MPDRLPDQAQGIRARLLQVIERHYDSQAAFQREWRLGRSTVREWLHRRRPKPPTLAFVLQLAQRHRLSMDWLLLGRGSPYQHGRLIPMRGVAGPQLLMSRVTELVRQAFAAGARAAAGQASKNPKRRKQKAVPRKTRVRKRKG